MLVIKLHSRMTRKFKKHQIFAMKIIFLYAALKKVSVTLSFYFVATNVLRFRGIMMLQL